VISLELATALRDAGLRWKPARGDRFVVPDREMDEDIFVLSDMTVEVHALPEGTVIGFNGTVEWALDDVDIAEAVWLPREDQLRGLLGSGFQRLEVVPRGYRVVCGRGTVEASTAEEAYALALLDLVRAAHS
jgi:hypothetical protein